MAWGTPMGTHKRVSKNTGTNAEIKRDGYAKGPVPPSMIGTKVGRVGSKGYTGPDIAVPPSS